MGFSRFEVLQAPGIVITGEQRATLVRRTYSVVLGCVLVTMAGTWFGLSNESLMVSTIQHPWITLLATMVPLWAAGAVRNISNVQRLGLVMLFSMMMGLAISPAIFAANRVAPGIVGQAAMLTGSTFAVLTTYAFTSRRDFSAWGSFFMVGFWVLLATSVLNLFFQNQTAHLWLAGGTVLVFSGLLVFDTWRLRNAYTPDDYIIAAVRIYVDLLNMFMAILTLLGGNRRSS